MTTTHIEVRNNYDSEFAEANDYVSATLPVMVSVIKNNMVENVAVAADVDDALKFLNVTGHVTINDLRDATK